MAAPGCEANAVTPVPLLAELDPEETIAASLANDSFTAGTVIQR